jgi:molybdate transport system ATP-binding protein
MVEKLLSVFDLQPYRNRYPAMLSGGQKQRTALARALVSNPKLLLLDEPLSALDPLLRAQLQTTISRIQQNFSLTTLIVSHDIAEIFRCAQKVYCINNGRITHHDTPARVFTPHADPLNSMCVIGDVVSMVSQGSVTHITLLNGTITTTIPCSTEALANIAIGDRIHVTVQGLNIVIENKLCRNN